MFVLFSSLLHAASLCEEGANFIRTSKDSYVVLDLPTSLDDMAMSCISVESLKGNNIEVAPLMDFQLRSSTLWKDWVTASQIGAADPRYAFRLDRMQQHPSIQKEIERSGGVIIQLGFYCETDEYFSKEYIWSVDDTKVCDTLHRIPESLMLWKSQADDALILFDKLPKNTVPDEIFRRQWGLHLQKIYTGKALTDEIEMHENTDWGSHYAFWIDGVRKYKNFSIRRLNSNQYIAHSQQQECLSIEAEGSEFPGMISAYELGDFIEINKITNMSQQDLDNRVNQLGADNLDTNGGEICTQYDYEITFTMENERIIGEKHSNSNSIITKLEQR